MVKKYTHFRFEKYTNAEIQYVLLGLKKRKQCYIQFPSGKFPFFSNPSKIDKKLASYKTKLLAIALEIYYYSILNKNIAIGVFNRK